MFANEFLVLVTKELEAQVAKIDEELRTLGIEPGPAELPTKVELVINLKTVSGRDLLEELDPVRSKNSNCREDGRPVWWCPTASLGGDQ